MGRCLLHKEHWTEVELERREAKVGDREAEIRKEVGCIRVAPGGAEGCRKERPLRG